MISLNLMRNHHYMEGHSRDYVDEIASLSISLEEERGLRLALEGHTTMILLNYRKDHDQALVLARVLKSEKVELGVVHDRLKQEFDILDKAHKALKSAHASLKESRDQLQMKLTKD